MLIIVTAAISSCSLILETDIEDEYVMLTAPADNLRTLTSSHAFCWEYVPEADKYNLQIAMPVFENSTRILLDTNVSTNNFNITLLPGQYEWRVRAENSAYRTGYSVRTLIIDTTLDLGNQYIILKTPVANDVTNYSEIAFEWFQLYNASSYRFEIRKASPENDLYMNPVDTTGSSLIIQLEEGTYIWAVKAVNEISASPYSTRTITVDTTTPGIPVPVSPDDNAVISAPDVVLTWERPDDGGSAIADSIYISRDRYNFIEQIVERGYSADKTYSFDAGEGGDFFWQIRTCDAAGNCSADGEIRKFTVNIQ